VTDPSSCDSDDDGDTSADRLKLVDGEVLDVEDLGNLLAVAKKTKVRYTRCD